MRTLAAYSTFGDLTNRPALDLAERVAALAPVGTQGVPHERRLGLDRHGAKLARRYWQLRGHPKRIDLSSVASAPTTGCTRAGTSLAGIPANPTGYGELIGTSPTVALGRRRRPARSDRAGGAPSGWPRSSASR